MQVTLEKFSGRVSGMDFGKAALWLLFSVLVMVLALFFGLLAVTANPILVGMGAGLVVGVFLLMKPDLLIWLILLLGLGGGAFISMVGPQFSKITWAVSILGFVLLFLSLFNLMLTTRSRSQPVFIWVALVFLLVAIGTTLAQWYSTGEVIAGVKRLFQAYGLMFAFATLALSSRQMGRFQKALLVIALLQLPFALYEFIVLVKLRGGLSGASGSSATDVVAGTFGANLEGGSPNSVMAVYLLITMGFLFARWKEKLLATPRLVMLALPMVAPFFLGEVKILFILIPVAFLVLMKRDIPRRPVFFVMMTLLALFFILLLGHLYATFIIQKPINDIIADTLAYNASETRGYGTYYLNRMSVLEFWWQQQGWSDPVVIVFGHGLGSAFSAPSVVPGHIAMRWPLYGIDLTTASSLLWDTGFVGLGLFVLTLWAAWRTCSVLQRDSRDVRVMADATAIQAAIALFGVFVIYNNALVNEPSMEIIVAVVLGYLAYLYRRHRLGMDPA